MRQRRTGALLIVFGVLLAVGAGLFVYFQMRAASAAIPEPKAKVVVAATAIAERTRVDRSMLKVVDLPQSVVPPAAVTKPEDAVDRLTVVPIFAGNPILATQIVSTTKGTGIASAALDAGKVLVAVNFRGAANILAAGAIRPGDTVDLIVHVPGPTGEFVEATTMQNLKVYDIGSVDSAARNGSSAVAAAAGSAPPAAPNSPIFIFKVSAEDALALKYIETLGPDLILRSAADANAAEEERPVIDYQYLEDRFHLPPRPQTQVGVPTGGTAPPAPAPAAPQPAPQPAPTTP